MDYEDDEIIIAHSDSILEKRKIQEANLVVRINLVNETFSVEKNRWGRTLTDAPLDYLDDYLERPDLQWFDFFVKYYESKMVK